MPVNEKYVEQYGLKSSDIMDQINHQQKLLEVIDEAKDLCRKLAKNDRINKRIDTFEDEAENARDVYAQSINLKRYSLKSGKALDSYSKKLTSCAAKLTQVISAVEDRESDTYKALKESISKIESMSASVNTVVKDDLVRYQDAADKLMGDKIKTYYRYSYNMNPIADKTYGKRTLPSSKYSVDRTAVITAAVCQMLREGYTAEQALDNEQFGDVKKKLFNEISERMTNNTPENQAWLAENFAEGMPKVLEAIDSKAKEIDPAKADLNNKDFVVLLSLAQVQHDVTQEIEHCDKEFDEYVTKNNKGDPEQLKQLFNTKGYLSTLQEHIGEAMLSVKQLADPLVDPRQKLYDATRNLIVFNWAKDKVFDELKADPNKRAYEVGADEEGYIGRSELTGKVPQVLGQDKYKLPSDITVKERHNVISNLLDGDVINKMNLAVQPNGTVKLVNVPPRSKFYREKLALDIFDTLSDEIDEAQVGVIGGSGEYNKAAEAIENFSESFKTDMGACRGKGVTRLQKMEKLDDLRESARRTEEKINDYLERKAKKGITAENADEKTKKRIVAMKKSLTAIRQAREEIDDLAVDNMSANLRTAGKLWLKSIREIDKVGLRNKKNRLSDKEREHVYKHMAIARTCYSEMVKLRDGKLEKPHTQKELSDMVFNRMKDQNYIDAVNWLDRKDVKKFIRDNGKELFTEVNRIRTERNAEQAKQAQKQGKNKAL